MSLARLLPGLISAQLLATGAGAFAASLVALTWLGLSIGQPAAQVRTQLGDPLLVRPLGISRVASYLRADDSSAAINVTERNGVVFAIEYLRERAESTPGLRDPYGVALGATRADVAKLRGKPAIDTGASWYYPVDPDEHATVIYRFEDDVLASIKLVGSPANAAGSDALPHIADPKGDSYGTAVLDMSAKFAASQHFREQYFSVRDCDKTGRSTTTERRSGKTYAIETAVCGGTKRTVYFDISHAAT